MTLVLKLGNRLPPLTATLTNDDEPVNLAAAAEIRCIGKRHGVLVFDRVVTGDALGQTTMQWQVGDTDELGYIEVTWDVIDGSGRKQTYPKEGVERVRVSP